MSAINNDWLDALKEEFKKPYYRKLFETVNQEYRTRQIFPPADDIFNAFHLTPLHKVKAVILGQDPYHNVGQAHGLCFSVQKGVEISVQLDNGYLTISAAKGLDKDEQDKKGKYIRKERYAGTMQRSFYVGDAVTQEDVKAKFEDGILKLSLPKKNAKAVEANNSIAIEG